MRRERLIWLVLSIGLGAGAAVAPWLSRPYDPSPGLALALSAAWAGVLAVGLLREGRWGLWLLLGAPGALLWPLLFASLGLGCAVWRACP